MSWTVDTVGEVFIGMNTVNAGFTIIDAARLTSFTVT
jgi:hypothetical protein